MNLLGLMGFAGAGKDEVGKVLVDHWGFRRIAFADKLKAVALAIGWDGEKDHAGRLLLQNLGVAVRDHVARDAWVDAAADEVIPLLNEGHGVVMTDVRFKNEIKWIRDCCGGEIWRVDRPGVGPLNGHISESEWTRVKPDRVVDNAGTLEHLVSVVGSKMNLAYSGR